MSVRWLFPVAMLGLFLMATANWSDGRSPVVPEPLVADQPYSVALRAGRATVDLYLEADVPVRLLVSNLGPAARKSILRARSEPLAEQPQYQPIAWRKKLHTASRPLRTGASITVVADAASVGADAGSIRHVPTVIDAPVLSPEKTVLNPSERRKSNSPPPPTRDFWLHVTDTPLENLNGYQLVKSRLASSQETVEVYADASLDSPSGLPEHIQELANEIAERLARDVLPRIVQQVGPIADPDQNGRLTVLLSPWLGRLRGGTTQVRGFVRSSDLRTDIAAPFSNHADLLYLSPHLPAGDALQSLLLHEVAHAALASRKDPSSHLALPDWEDWLNEGMAHLAERLGRTDWSNLDYRVARFWQHPESAPLVVRDYYRTGRWRDHGCRGATFLFLEWCQQQARNRGVTHFIPALMATGKPNQEALEMVCQSPFADLYREWTISLASSNPQLQRPKTGRFLSSGPRFHQWNLSQDPAQEFDVSGSATQFVELRTIQAGWYRLTFLGDAIDEWQLTVMRPAQPLPAIAIDANWLRAETSNSSGLMVSTVEPLPAGWKLDEVSCELIREPHPRVWNWPAAGLAAAGDVSDSITVPLSSEDVAGSAAVIKVRFQNAAHQKITWGWADVPPYRAVEKLANGGSS